MLWKKSQKATHKVSGSPFDSFPPRVFSWPTFGQLSMWKRDTHKFSFLAFFESGRRGGVIIGDRDLRLVSCFFCISADREEYLMHSDISRFSTLAFRCYCRKTTALMPRPHIAPTPVVIFVSRAAGKVESILVIASRDTLRLLGSENWQRPGYNVRFILYGIRSKSRVHFNHLTHTERQELLPCLDGTCSRQTPSISLSLRY